VLNLFDDIVNEVQQIGVDVHEHQIIKHAQANLSSVTKSIKQLAPLNEEKLQSAILISAGPSVHKNNSINQIVEHNYKGTVIAVDGTYIACLKAGLIPDFVVTLDPHPTRMVRWFGDHDFEKHIQSDDYFSRQDLNVEFRKNSIEQNKQHIELVNKYGHLSKIIVSSSAPHNVVQRIKEAKFDDYWWNPLVDNPHQPNSITRKLYKINKLPCMNTGGTVGSASWVFAHSILKLPRIALVGVDLGYYHETPYELTQTYYELIAHLGSEDSIKDCFREYEFPLTKEKFYTDPTYFWYRKNFLELLQKSTSETYNCTEGGTLFGDNVKCVILKDFLEEHC